MIAECTHCRRRAAGQQTHSRVCFCGRKIDGYHAKTQALRALRYQNRVSEAEYDFLLASCDLWDADNDDIVSDKDTRDAAILKTILAAHMLIDALEDGCCAEDMRDAQARKEKLFDEIASLEQRLLGTRQ